MENQFYRGQLKIDLQCFEENQKKPGGCFYGKYKI